jgi:ABC-type Fe3+-hydroxamate transport system substrate-binding protein
MLALMQMGYDVKCAVTNNGETVTWPSGDGSPPLGAQIAAQDHTQIVGGSTTNGYDYDELAQCHPDYVIDYDNFQNGTDAYPTITPADIAADNSSTEGTDDTAVAPTIWYGYNFIQNGAGNGDTTSPIVSLWKGVFMDIALELQNQGATDALARAEDVLTLMDLRATALRGQVAGVPIVEFEASPTSWGMGNDYFPEDSMFYGPDLGMDGIILPAADYNTGGFDTGCVPPAVPKDCYGYGLSDEDYYILDKAKVLIADISPTGFSAMKSDPLFQDIPAVKAHHYELDPGEIRLAGLTAAFDYTLVEEALKISEYHVAVSSSPGATASLTLDPATQKVCYAVDPTAGSLPADSIKLKGPAIAVKPPKGKKGKKGKKAKKVKPVPLTITLAKKAGYVNPEPLPQWNTSPATYQAAGCVKLSKAAEATLSSKPTKFVLDFGSGSGPLAKGPLNVVVSS